MSNYPEEFISPAPKESPEEHNQRFAEGKITEQEIKEYWLDPSKPFFEYELPSKLEDAESGIKLKVWGLTEDISGRLLSAVKESWASEYDYEAMKKTLEKFFAQKQLHHPLLSNTEYYVATDANDKPIAITGIYTVDIQGVAGFATRKDLDPSRHFMVARIAWTAVSKQMQGKGVAGSLIDWVENMSKHRGAKFIQAEIDDAPTESNMVQRYERHGYTSGFDIKDYFGPGRDLHTYYINLAEEKDAVSSPVPNEKISINNKEEILDIARRNYSPARFEEFISCLNLFLQQEEGQTAIRRPHSFILRDANGKIESFAIFVTGDVYQNMMSNYWYALNKKIDGSEERLLNSMKAFSLSKNKKILFVSREGADSDLTQAGFKKPSPGIPETYVAGDPTQFILYTKRFSP